MYEVAIPSVARAERITKATLPLLHHGGVPMDHVTIFVPDVESEDQYADAVAEFGCKITSGHGIGMREARNAIARSYPEGTQLVEVDDDITAFKRAVDNKTLLSLEAGELHATWQKCFAQADGHLWCWYPVANAFFMKGDRVRRGGLWYAVGALFGYTVVGDDAELVYVDDKEDFERSMRFYLRDGEVVRFDGYTFVTRYYGEPGGMQLYRSKNTIEAGARRLAANYPDLCTAYMKKSGRAEVRLKAGHR